MQLAENSNKTLFELLPEMFGDCLSPLELEFWIEWQEYQKSLRPKENGDSENN